MMYGDKSQGTFKNESYSLISSDIKGASPKKLIPKTINKPDYIYSNSDIAESSPKKLFPERKKVDLRYTTKDIEGKPKGKIPERKFPMNPANPKYKSPIVQEAPVPPTKFIRDTLQVSDIQGTSPKKPKEVRKHDPMDYSDIYKVTSKTAAKETPASATGL